MFKSTDCLIVMGRRGCGKSYLAKKLQEMWPRKIIFDPLNEYQSEGQAILSFQEYCQVMQELKARSPEQFTIVVKFDIESHLSELEFDQMLRIAYYYANIQIVIEEIQLFSNAHFIPHWLKNCLLTGRHQNISLLFTTQRPAELHKTILSQCSHVFCGSLIEGNDVKYISGFLRQDAQKLVRLPDRRFIYFSSQGITEINNDLSSSRSQVPKITTKQEINNSADLISNHTELDKN